MVKAAGLTYSKLSSGEIRTRKIISAAFSAKCRKRASLSAKACSRRRSSVTSRNTKTAPTIRPSRLRIGATLSEIGRSKPVRVISTLFLGIVIVLPSRIAFSIGLSAGSRVYSSNTRKTSLNGRPSESSLLHSVRLSAAPFIRAIRPLASVATTPSPILASVTASSSFSACICCIICFSTVISLVMHDNPHVFPSASGIIAMVRATSIVSPSFRTLSVAKSLICSPLQTRFRSSANSSAFSAGMS